MPYELVKEPDESLLGTVGRGAARSVARAGEAIAGLPGDIIGGVAGLANLATGGKVPGLAQVQQYAPGSQFIREKVTKPLTGEYLEPKGSGEAFLDEIVGDLSTLLVPGGIASKGASLTGRGLAKAAGKAVAGVTAGRAVKELTGSELAGGLAKFTTLSLANTLGGRKALTKQMYQNYEMADKSIPEGTIIKADNLKNNLTKDIQVITKGVSPAKNEMLGVLSGVKKNINKADNIKIKDVWNLKKNINEWLSDPKLDKTTRGQFKKTLGNLNETLSEYAKENPEFAQNFYPAESMYKAINEGSTLNKFLQNNVTLKKALDKWAPLSAVGYGLYHYGAVKPLTLAGMLTTGIGVRESVKMGEFLARSPEARKYYMSLLKASATNDAATAAKSIKKIDQLALQDEKSQGISGRYQLIS